MVVLTAFMGGLLPSRFMFSLSKALLEDMAKLMIWAQKYMNIEDTQRGRDSGDLSKADK